LLNKLIEKGCLDFQLILNSDVEKELLKNILGVFKTSSAKNVEIIFNQPHFNEQELREITNDSRVIYKIYGAAKDEIIASTWVDAERLSDYPLIQFKSIALDLNTRTSYKEENFITILQQFTGAIHFNRGLYKKVCIDNQGNFKNYISHQKTFGNIKTKTLDQLLEDTEFTKYWELNNDKIEKCKDCQFRYICASNSEIEMRDGKYYKMDDCNFDPYSNKWL